MKLFSSNLCKSLNIIKLQGFYQPNMSIISVNRTFCVFRENKKSLNSLKFSDFRLFALNLRGATGNRTRDTRIFSPLLYQLSYGTRFSLELPSLSIGIAKVDIFSLPANFSSSFFAINASFHIQRAETIKLLMSFYIVI